MKICITISLLCSINLINAQFLDKLGNKVEKAVERTVERRVERETTKSTDRVLDTIVDSPKNSKKNRGKNEKNKKKNGGNIIGGNENYSNNDGSQQSNKVNANFDFEPGNIVIFRR